MEWLKQELLAKLNSYKIGLKASILKDINWYLDDIYIIFVIIAIIGMFGIIAGERRIGTKITSLSIIVYLVSRVVLTCLF